MKINFKKISAVLTSGIMTVSSIGFAAAANYPTPFVSGGSANVAIVYGTGDGVSTLDILQAGDIQSNLQSYMGLASGGATSGTASGGDSVKIEKSSTKFNLGKGIADIISTSITDDSPNGGLPILLADGKYVDDDNDEKDYTQKIDLANLTFKMFDDDDYKADSPTLGMRIASADHVLNYTLDFTDEPEWADLDSTNIEIMGKNYFILSHTANTTINLLDAAETTTLAEGETKTVNGHEVSIAFIGGTGTSAEVKLSVDGETTNSLSEAQTQKLSSGDYVGIKDISVQDYAGGTKTVEFSIGSGKLVLKHGYDVEINDKSISGMKTYITTTSSATATISKIAIEWKADDELFLAPDSEILMPGFKAVKLSYAGILYPAEEVMEIRGGSTTYATLENFPLKDSTEDINIIYGDSANFTGVGKDSTHQLRTSNESELVFDKDTDDWFLVSYNDGSNAESYLMRATNFGLVDGSTTANKTTIQYRKNGAWVDLKVDAKIADVISVGNVELTINIINRASVNNVNFTASGSNVEFNRLYSKEGMQVYVPWYANQTNAPAGSGNLYWNSTDAQTTFNLTFSEEDKNGNIGKGENVTVQLGWNSATTPEAYVSDILGEAVTFAENGDNTKKWLSYWYSQLATSIIWDKSGDQYSATLSYHGDETYGEFYVNAPDTTVTPGTSGTTGSTTQLGSVLAKDNEISSVSSKNLIIVGGSCINSAAATALGVATHTCGPEFTTATGVGSGEFLIKGVSDAFTSGKIALVVAGYEAADTVNAAKYLTTQTVDTSKEYKGTSSTSAELVTTTA
ncbi:MAG: hypothetical protein ABH811_02730 [archaeon]